MWHHNTFDS